MEKMKIDFQQIYSQISIQEPGTQKRLDVASKLGIFVGFNHSGNLRLSFLSTIPSPKLESTKLLRVLQSVEKKNSFWISFELLDANANDEFFTFCENMIEAVVDVQDEKQALNKLKRRYFTWRSLFQKHNDKTLPREVLQGLYGELYYLSNNLIPAFGTQTAVSSWGGPDLQAKDFTLADTWFEVKTIGSTVDRVHISSLTQLDSEMDGHLIVIRVEAVSPEYEGNNCKISKLITDILSAIDDDVTESTFVSKLNSLGVNIFDCQKYKGFRLLSLNSYLVDESFPRIRRKDLLHEEIIGVQYDLSLASIHPYKEA
jgi:hypothetical protein